MLLLNILAAGLVPAAILFFALNWSHMRLTGGRFWFRDASGALIGSALGQAIGVSVALGAINVTAPMLTGAWTWLSIPMLLAMLTGFVNLFIWAHRDVDSPLEMLIFAAMAFEIALATGTVVGVVATLIPWALLSAVVMALPWLAFWGFLGYMITDALINVHYRGTGRRGFLVGGIITAIVCGVIFLGILGNVIYRNVDWSNLFKEEVTSTTPGDAPSVPPAGEPASTDLTVAQIKAMWEIGNDKLILNNYDSTGALLTGDALTQARLDDQDFGPGILEEAVNQALADGKFKVGDMANKTERQLYEMVGADTVMKVLTDRWAKDPIAGAGAMVYYDALFHTREFGGEFISQYEDQPDRYAQVLNDAKDAWLRDKAAYFAKLEHFYNIIYSATRITIEYRSSGITDQLYTTGPRTANEIDTIMQDLIVYETYEHSGYFVTFEWPVKGTTIQTMSLRLDCGGQPCNVSEVLGVTPAPNPNGSKPVTTTPKPSTKPGGNGDGGDPGNGGGGDGGDPGTEPTPTPTPTPPMSNPKDPTKGTDVPVNDVPGPGPDTNNGVGAQFSSVQEPDGSVYLPSYEDYTQAIDPVENNPARPAGTPNTPSYTPPTPPAAVDNNGDSGYGWGGADDPTPVQPPSEVDTPGYDPGNTKVEWGGPGL